MRQVTHVDDAGRKWDVMLPDGAPISDAAMGLHVGPPPVDELGLPEPWATRLHNELHARNVFTVRDAETRRQDILAAIIATFKIDVQQIVDIYRAVAGTPPPVAVASDNGRAAIVERVGLMAVAPDSVRTNPKPTTAPSVRGRRTQGGK